MNKIVLYQLVASHGRLGNQLYCCLNAFINRDVSAILRKDQFEHLAKLNCGKYAIYTKKYDEIKKGYFSHINIDFTEDQLNSFIEDTVIKSPLFKDCQLDSSNLYIGIRNGDYVEKKIVRKHRCYFDRADYFKKAIEEAEKNENFNSIYIVSDDIQACKQYDGIFKSYANDVKYFHHISPLDDLKLLSCARRKILMNSTFHIWSSFISDVLFSKKFTKTEMYMPDFMAKNLEDMHMNDILTTTLTKPTCKIITTHQKLMHENEMRNCQH